MTKRQIILREVEVKFPTPECLRDEAGIGPGYATVEETSGRESWTAASDAFLKKVKGAR